MFPVIKHINDLQPFISGKQYIIVSDQEANSKVVCYQVSVKDAFSTSFEKECRGITFDSEGYVISRPLHKFFNLNEREEYRVENIDWNSVKAIYPKLDGSMISAAKLNGEYRLKSKMSFKSDVAIAASNFIEGKEDYHNLIKETVDAGLTPIFEYTSPNSRIVIEYFEENLTLLHVRDNITGEYLDAQYFAEKHNIPFAGISFEPNTAIQDILDIVKNAKGIEGYIIQFNNGDMVKIKTPWYCDIHGAISFLRERDIAKLVINQKLDDMRSILQLNGYDGVDFDRIDQIEKEINDFINDLKMRTNNIVDSAYARDLTKKQLVEEYRDHELFWLIVKTFDNHYIDYTEYYRKVYLKEHWSLKMIIGGI